MFNGLEEKILRIANHIGMFHRSAPSLNIQSQ